MSEWRNFPYAQGDQEYLKERLEEVARSMGLPEEKILRQDFQLACEETGALKAEAVMSHRWGLGHIDYLYVEENYRRVGCGREMLNLIEHFARANNIKSLQAETHTLECSELYAHCGFQELGRVPMGVSVNGVVPSHVTFAKILT